MKFLILFLTVILGLSQVAPLAAAGPTNVKDPITASTTWTKDGSPYVIQNDVTVVQGAILTLEPGVEIRFVAPASGSPAGGPNLIVQGGLKAIGNATAPIMFNPSEQGAIWGAIYFYNADSANCVLQACLIKGGRVVCNNASPVIAQSSVFGSKSGIEIANNSQPQILGNRITGNGIGVVILSNSASPVITGNEIYNNNYGVYLKDFGAPQITNNKIQENLKYNMVNYSPKSLAVPNNNFGVTDYQQVMKTIYDGAWSASLGRLIYMQTPVAAQNQTASALAPAASGTVEKPQIEDNTLWSYGRPFDAMKLSNQDAKKKKSDSAIKVLAVGATAILAVGLFFL